MSDGAYTLYWAPETGAFVVHALLEEAGAAYTLAPIDLARREHKQPGYLAVNPLGQIPALATPGGTVLTESAAMVLHLAEQFPAAALMPPPGGDARAVFYRWLLFLAANVYTADLRIYHAERFTNDADGAPGVKAAALAEMSRCLEIVNGAVAGDFLLGEYSALDPYLVMLVEWHPEVSALLARHPALARLRERTLARPAVARIWAQNFPH